MTLTEGDGSTSALPDITVGDAIFPQAPDMSNGETITAVNTGTGVLTLSDWPYNFQDSKRPTNFFLIGN